MNEFANNNNTSTKDLCKTVFILAVPVIIEMLMQTLLGVVDTAMVGRLGAYAIGAVSFTEYAVLIFIAFFSALGTGTTALVARYRGGHNFRDMQRVGSQSMLLNVICSVIFLAFGVLCAEYILKWLGVQSDIMEEAKKYFVIIVYGVPFLGTITILSGMMRGAGDMKTPMFINGLANVINIIGNFFLIFESRMIHIDIPVIGIVFDIFMPGAGLGVAGAAISTTFSRAVAAAMLVYIAYSQSGRYALKVSDGTKCDKEILPKIVKIGMPAAAEQVAMRLAQIIFFKIIADLGTVMVAANKVTNTAESISFNVGWGFALAATTLVGQYLGAGNSKMAEKAGHISNYMAMAVMSIMGVFFFFGPEIFIRLFTNDHAVFAPATTCLKIAAVCQPFLAMAMVYAGNLRGAGDTKSVLIIVMIAMWVFRVGLAWVLVKLLNFGLAGAWMCMIAEFLVRGFWLKFIFNKGKWKDIKI